MMKFKVLLGESEIASECDTFAMYKITDIPPGPAGSQEFELTLQINEDNNLKVTATHV